MNHEIAPPARHPFLTSQHHQRLHDCPDLRRRRNEHWLLVPKDIDYLASHQRDVIWTIPRLWLPGSAAQQKCFKSCLAKVHALHQLHCLTSD